MQSWSVACSFLYLATRLPTVCGTRSYDEVSEEMVRSFSMTSHTTCSLNSSEYLAAGLASILSIDGNKNPPVRETPRTPKQVLTSARDHAQRPGRTAAVAHEGQVDDDGDIAVTLPGVAPDRGGHLPHGSEARGGIVDAEDLHPLESVGRLVEDLLGSGQDCIVGNMPGDHQGGCYPGNRHALQGKGTQPPLHC